MIKIIRSVLIPALSVLLVLGFLCSCIGDNGSSGDVVSVNDIPAYDGQIYVEIDGNVPSFTEEELQEAKESYKRFGELDSKGRCTAAQASLSYDTMPDQRFEERGDISGVHPTGWHSGMEWERMHLIAWSLSGENANVRNLITGTHDCNFNAMREFEEETAGYLNDHHGRHVLYRVTPVFSGKEMIARGVQMEAESVEDKGRGLCFNVYCYNVRSDGGVIDYKTGVVDLEKASGASHKDNDKRAYVLNTSSMKFHYPSCSGAKDIAEWNREDVKATRKELIEKGYDPCGLCEP